MKILVVNNMCPFIHGGAEELANHLVHNLRLHGFESELLRLPFQWDPAENIIDEMLMCRQLRLINVDKVIALKFPAYLIPFDDKVFWLLHQYRQAYDLWDAKQSNIPKTNRGLQIREAIFNADNQAFSKAKKIYTNSRVTQKRLKNYNKFDAEVLLPPLNDAVLFHNKGYKNYIFAGGRINQSKRQHLLVEAMRYVSKELKLIIAGPADSESDANNLKRLIEKYDLSKRVHLDIGFFPRQKIADYVNHALACAYLPFDEDSVGYVTMEAFNASKAVVTVSDSGGVLDLVKDKKTGVVAKPNAEALARKINSFASHQFLCKELGERAKSFWQSLNISWETTVEKLVQ